MFFHFPIISLEIFLVGYIVMLRINLFLYVKFLCTFDFVLFFVFIKGNKCCSDTTISFHYVTPERQYLIDKVRYGFNDRR